MRYYTIAGEPEAVACEDDAGAWQIIRPADAAWAEYEAWLAEGNVPAPFEGTTEPLTLEQAQTQAFDATNRAADEAMAPVLSQYSSAEVTTWPEQVAEAHAWLSDPNADTPLIDAVAGTDGDKAALVATILSKSAAYKAQSGQVIAWRRAVSEWIAAQTTPQAFDRFNPRFPELPA